MGTPLCRGPNPVFQNPVSAAFQPEMLSPRDCRSGQTEMEARARALVGFCLSPPWALEAGLFVDTQQAVYPQAESLTPLSLLPHAIWQVD